MRLADSTTDSLFIVNCFGYFLWMFFKKCKILNIGDANLQQKWASQQKNSAFCLRKLTCFVAKWHLWSIFVQNFNLLVSKTKLHWLAQQLERNSLLTRIFEPISLWQQKSFVLTRDVDSAHIVLRGSSPGLLTFSHIFGSERRLRRAFWEGEFFLQYFRQVCNIVTIHDISKNAQLKWWKTCIKIYGG